MTIPDLPPDYDVSRGGDGQGWFIYHADNLLDDDDYLNLPSEEAAEREAWRHFYEYAASLEWIEFLQAHGAPQL